MDIEFERQPTESIGMCLWVPRSELPYKTPPTIELELGGISYIVDTKRADTEEDLIHVAMVRSMAFSKPVEDMIHNIHTLQSYNPDVVYYLTAIKRVEKIDACRKTIPVGTVTIVPVFDTWFEIFNMCTIPRSAAVSLNVPLQRQGLGRYTLTSAINDICMRYTRPNLGYLTFGLDSVPEAVGFYQRLGFTASS